MAYPYPAKTRHKFQEIIVIEASGSCSAGTVTFNSALPNSAFAVGAAAYAVGNDQPVVITSYQYADRDQTITGDSSYKFLKTGESTATTNLTIPTATATQVGITGALIPAGDQYGLAAPVLPVYGAKITVDTTATTGTWYLAYSAVEL